MNIDLFIQICGMIMLGTITILVAVLVGILCYKLVSLVIEDHK